MSTALLKAYVVSTTATISAGSGGTTITASANTGDWVTGGGWATPDDGSHDDVWIYNSSPVVASGVATGWTATFSNEDTSDHTATVYALCVSVPA